MFLQFHLQQVSLTVYVKQLRLASSQPSASS